MDNFHKDYYEEFNSSNKSKAVINLDGNLSEKKQKSKRMEQNIKDNNLIIKNKNDDIEDTFCYKLFEEQYFDTDKLKELINYALFNKLDVKEIGILKWIINCVDNCFIYHKDVDDYYRIKNYSKAIENEWNTDWKLKLIDVLKKK